MYDTLDYTDFSTAQEIRIFQRVKFRQMHLGEACRNVLCELTGGEIGDGYRSNKQFLNTHLGKYRVALNEKSDNSTELAMLIRMGVRIVYAGKKESVMPFLKRHGVEITWLRLQRLIQRELEAME